VIGRAGPQSPGRGLMRKFFSRGIVRHLVRLSSIGPLAWYFKHAVADLVFGNPSLMSREVFDILRGSAVEARILFTGRLKWRPPAQDPASLLRQVTCPSLVLWGSEDKIIPARACSFFTENLPQAASHVFVSVGHMPMLEVPKDFNEVVLKFLNSNGLPSR